jgi:hypothetical protein
MATGVALVAHFNRACIGRNDGQAKIARRCAGSFSDTRGDAKVSGQICRRITSLGHWLFSQRALSRKPFVGLDAPKFGPDVPKSFRTPFLDIGTHALGAACEVPMSTESLPVD